LKKLYSKRVSELESQLSQKTKRVEQLETDKQVNIKAATDSVAAQCLDCTDTQICAHKISGVTTSEAPRGKHFQAPHSHSTPTD